MTFLHDDSIQIPPVKFDVYNNDQGHRLYKVDGLEYPSVTTVLSIQKKEYLEKWKERVGEKEAVRVSNLAKNRGTIIHKMVEDYLNNDINVASFPIVDQHTFKEFKPVLDKITKVYQQEIFLYSKNYLKIAGRTDLIADYEDILSIIDFKTSKTHKSKSDIEHYFIQKTAYSVCLEEMTGIKIKNLVCLISVDDGPPLCYTDVRSNYLQKLVDVREEFRKQCGY